MKESGFTLIELLVVIAIIGILAGLTLTGFSAARKQARDTTRKSDLAQYRTALEAYAANNNGKYPVFKDAVLGDGSIINGTIFGGGGPLISEYLPEVIVPPGGSKTWWYFYTTETATEYVMQANLETGGHWEICSNGKAGFTSTFVTWGTPTCSL